MNYVDEIALAFSLLSFGCLALASMVNFRGIWVNLSPYICLGFSGGFYGLGRSIETIGPVAILLLIILLLHALLAFSERR